ncbi:MAG: fumarylacetoacetate hydrolase, partial [Hyphomicrobiaceae bacterium]
MREYMTPDAALPEDGTAGLMAGRVWRPDVCGPSVVAIRKDGVFDVSRHAATMHDLAESSDVASIIKNASGDRLGDLTEILENTPRADRNSERPWLLAPIDLQAIKAAGVTFARSM